jgi:hypothetical protein
MRLIADRTGKYGGQDPIEWLDADGAWNEVWTSKGEHPIAARCSVYRKDWNRKATAVVRWESYSQDNSMWKRMPDVMLGKCAESLALRRAFPAEMSGLAANIDQEFNESAFEAENEKAKWSQADENQYIEERTASIERAEGLIEAEDILEAVQAPPRPNPPPPAPPTGPRPDSRLAPDEIPFDPPGTPATDGQQKAIAANGRMLAWTGAQLAANVQERQNKDWSDLTEFEAASVIDWLCSLLEAKGKKGIKAD